LGRVSARVEALQSLQAASGRSGNRAVEAAVDKAIAREREKSAIRAVEARANEASAEQIEAARAVFESRQARGQPLTGQMTDEDRLAIRARKERVRLLRGPGSSGSSSSNSSSSSSNHQPDPVSVIMDSSKELAQLWDPRSTLRIRELALAMATAADTAEFAITAELAVDAAVAARNRAAAAATEAATAPERVENGPGNGASPRSHATERVEPLARGWSSASVIHRRGQGWSLRPHPAEGAPPPPQPELASLD